MVVPSPARLIVSRDALASIQRRDRDPGLWRIRRGVYVLKKEWDALTPWDRYRVRVHAVARMWSEPVFCLESAAALQGAPIFGEPRDIHVMSTDGRSWREGDVVVHGSRDPRAAAQSEGFWATPPADTTLDLCRVLPPAQALAVADAHLRSLPVGVEAADLQRIGAEQSNRRGLRRLEWVQARRTSRAESTGESISRAVIEWLGYDAPELQVEFPHDFGIDRPDFFWPRAGVVGEFDGYEKYRGSDVEDTRRRIVDEKRRENRLRRKVTALTRWDWDDAHHPASLDRALRSAGLIPRRPANQAMLTTLAARARSVR